jgi:hypothetical protein
VYVDAHSAYDATDAKDVTVQCPSGKKVVGGGATITAITGSSAPIVLTSSEPFNALNHWYARGRENAPYGSQWRVTAIALCATVTP